MPPTLAGAFNRLGSKSAAVILCSSSLRPNADIGSLVATAFAERRMLGKRPSRAPSASALAAATISPLLAMAGFCFQVARIASSMVKGAAVARDGSESTTAVSAQPWRPRRVRFSMTCRIRTLLGADLGRKDSSQARFFQESVPAAGAACAATRGRNTAAASGTSVACVVGTTARCPRADEGGR